MSDDTYPQATWAPPWPREKWPDVGIAPELRPVDFPLDRPASVQPTTVPVLPPLDPAPPASPDPGAASLADRVEFSPTPSRAGREGDSQGLPIVRPGASDIQSAVIADIEARREVGISRYGTALQAHNGRNALLDLYEELLDACMYAKQRLVEAEDDTAPEDDTAGEFLRYMIEVEDGPCRVDHHGYCQEHPGGWREGGCWVAAVRAFLNPEDNNG